MGREGRARKGKEGEATWPFRGKTRKRRNKKVDEISESGLDGTIFHPL